MDGSVSFHVQDIEFNVPFPRKTRKWILDIISAEKRRLIAIHYIFCSDSFLLSLNLRFLKHKTFTDILTFDYSEQGLINADIYISVERVRENSLKFHNTFEHELRRVMIHGVLHLLGYSDKTSGEKSTMRKREEACLSLYK
jgi:rRNA maturation RNase YbeY